jgi:hypothetical protein
MSEEPKHYVLNAETGHFEIRGSGSALANTAIIATEAIRAPLETTVVGLPDPEQTRGVGTPVGRRRVAGEAKPRSIEISPTFKLVFLSVLTVTVLTGVAQIIMAGFWEKPSPSQQQVFEAMGFAWKLCLGAIVGLLGGKVA